MTTGRVMPRSFYNRDAVTVARELLGKVLVKGSAAGVIVETEAYPGGDDLASHSAAGMTKRTKVIFGPPGHAYVYLCYGMHICMNIVTQPEGTAGCVLIRGLEALSGPGRLTKALGISLSDYGVDLTCGEFVVRERPGAERFRIEVTPRIGIRKCADLPLRFVMRPEGI